MANRNILFYPEKSKTGYPNSFDFERNAMKKVFVVLSGDQNKRMKKMITKFKGGEYVKSAPKYRRNFERSDGLGGYAFDCDKTGKQLETANEAAKKNYARCLDGTYNVIDRGIATVDTSYYEPKQGLCECGEWVYLDRFTCSCDCGRDYNSAGQELAPREQWGEETGEHIADIMRIR